MRVNSDIMSMTCLPKLPQISAKVEKWDFDIEGFKKSEHFVGEG